VGALCLEVCCSCEGTTTISQLFWEPGSSIYLAVDHGICFDATARSRVCLFAALGAKEKDRSRGSCSPQFTITIATFKSSKRQSHASSSLDTNHGGKAVHSSVEAKATEEYGIPKTTLFESSPSTAAAASSCLWDRKF